MSQLRDSSASLLGHASENLLRSFTTFYRRVTVDVAAPEQMYQRVIRLRAAQLRRLTSHRRFSFSEGDYSARVDKRRSNEDQKWASTLSR